MADKSHQRAGLIFLGVCVAIGIGVFAIDQGKDALHQLATPTAMASAAPRPVASDRADPYQPAQYQTPNGEPAEATGDPASSEPVSRADKSEPAAPNSSAREDEATAFAQEFFTAGSDDQDQALAWLSQHYAPYVDFFGRRRARSGILAEKTAFLRRWPTRSYTVEPASIRVLCDHPQPACTTTGIVDWSASSDERAASSQGKASFEIVTYRLPDGLSIIGESSKVIAR